MKNTAYLLVFNGFADWEPALAICEINKQPGNKIITVGFTNEIVTSMGGLKVIPDITLEKIDITQALIFILPGGDMWEKFENVDFYNILKNLHESQVPIAAICAATLVIVRANIIKNMEHTSNSLSYLKSMIPTYQEELYYRNDLAVTSHNIITASGVGNVEFASEILKILSIYDEETRISWYDLFKHGILPAKYK